MVDKLELDRLDHLRMEGHNEPCYYCREPCNGLAAYPSLWPIPLCHSDEPGKVKWHHIGCVTERLVRLEKLEKFVGKLSVDIKFLEQGLTENDSET